VPRRERGARTPQTGIDLVKRRLRDAERYEKKRKP
jgi:hypothetical protein